jgi:hypothetical protein
MDFMKPQSGVRKRTSRDYVWDSRPLVLLIGYSGLFGFFLFSGQFIKRILDSFLQADGFIGVFLI